MRGRPKGAKDLTTRKKGPVFPRMENLVEKITESGCWIWTGLLLNNGYPVFWKNGKNVTAHRAMYEEINGSIPKGLFICHTCDIKCCVNPSHLYAGTHLQNMKDARDRDRFHKEFSNHMTKVSNDQILEILEMLQTGKTQKSISQIYGVSRRLIGRIKTGDRSRGISVPRINPNNPESK